MLPSQDTHLNSVDVAEPPIPAKTKIIEKNNSISGSKCVIVSFICVVVGFSLHNARSSYSRIASASPRAINMKPASLDLGVVGEGRFVERTIRVQNASNKNIPITKITTSCGCTTTNAPSFVPAEGEAQIQVAYDTTKRTGNIRQYVTVEFSGTNHGTVTIPVTGKVISAVKLSRELFDLGDGKKRSANLVISRVDSQMLSGIVAEVPEGIVVTTKPLSASSLSITATSVKKTAVGAHNEKLLLNLNHPLMPQMSIPVIWNVPSKHSIKPETLNFGVKPPNSSLQGSVSISDINPNLFRVTAKPSGWNVKIEKGQKNTVLLHVSGAFSGRKGGLFNAKITCSTGDPQEPTIVIPLVAAVGNDIDEPCKIPGRNL